MVRILANGDVVPDDDPRARQATNRNDARNPRTQTGNVHHPQHRQDHAPGQQISIFGALNQRLLGFGIPRWNIGQTVIEPIVSVGFLLALMLFGLPGVIFGAVLFAVSKWSQDGAPEFLSGFLGNRNNTSSGRRGGGGGRSNGGHRLGHS